MLRAGNLLPKPITIRTQSQLEQAVAELWDAPMLAYDTETTGLSRPRDIARFLALSDGKRRYCIGPELIMADEVKLLMEKPDQKLIAHNANFDAWMMHNINVHVYRIPERTYDTAVMHLLYDDLSPHSLDVVASQLVNIHKYSFTTAFPEAKKERGIKIGEMLDKIWATDPERVSHYASLDAYATYKVFIKLRELLQGMKIMDEQTLWDYYCTYELPFTSVLLSMEMTGVEVDMTTLQAMRPDLDQREHDLRRWFAKEAGTLVRPTGKKISEFFFDNLKLPPLKLSEETGVPSLDKETLKMWAATGSEHAQKLLEWRQTIDMRTRYVANLENLVHKKTGRLHTTFNQHIVKTGRLSSSDPNLQNQPPEVRKVFVASKGKRLLVMDYGQVEWRITAYLSGDVRMTKDIQEGKDAHAATAAAMFEVPYEDVIAAKKVEDEELLTERQVQLLRLRSLAKTLNFGILYGEGPHKLSQQLGITVDEAKSLLRKFRETYPELHKYFRDTINLATEMGYCQTLLGRPRQLPNLGSANRARAASDERRAKNSPIQGSAADIIKAAMVNLWRNKYFTSGQATILLQVHDELVIEIDEELEHDEAFNTTVDYHMKNPLGPLTLGPDIPLTIDKAYADNWREGK